MTKSIKSYALKFLSKRDYAYLELYNKLKKYSDDEIVIKNVLDELSTKGWLSEERYINSYISFKSQKYSLSRIRNTLIGKTCNPKLVEQEISKHDLNEYDVAFKLWQRKFGVVSSDLKEKSRQVRFLANKGFNFEVINKIVNNRIL